MSKNCLFFKDLGIKSLGLKLLPTPKQYLQLPLGTSN